MKRLNLLLGVLLLVQCAWLLGENVLVGEGRGPGEPGGGDRLFPGFARARVAALAITGARGAVELKRAGEGWVVSSEGARPADEKLVESALLALEELRPGRIVSENPAKHESFDVAGAGALEVLARDGAGAVLAHFILGKSAASGSGAYLRCPPDAGGVMLIRSSIRGAFDRDGGRKGAWRDKTVFAADSRRIRRLEILKPAETIEIERVLAPSSEAGREGVLVASDEDDWQMLRPLSGLLSRFTGNNLARTAAELKCDGFAALDRPLAELGLDPPEARVTAFLDEGEPLVFEIGAQEESRRYVRVPGRDEILTVPSFRLFDFLREAKELAQAGAE
ncbi:MAG: DUF4340 domain-containing protein [Planctomycetes bacterium]|nr:DUF4340 domain-containing protein [Planctomycetota bacterium]